MAAMNHMLPEDPDDRAVILDSLRDAPEIEAFAERLLDHARELYGHAVMTFQARQYDEWDPPLQIVITAPMPDSRYGEYYYELLKWANNDPDYDTGKLQVILHRQRAPSMSR
jgi:hypothetical protein